MCRRRLTQWVVGVCMILIVSGLASCGPNITTVGQSILDTPMPADIDFQLTPRPRPTRADGKPYRSNGWFVTPLPDERVRVGNIVEIAPFATPTPMRYSIRNEYVGEGTNKKFVLFVLDTQTGREVRLGNDNGHAMFGAMNGDFVIWRYLCDDCSELKSGLYAHSLQTNIEILITDTLSGKGYPEIYDQWVIYVDIQPASPYIASLYAHNLGTSENLLITDNLVLLLASPSDLYEISGDKIVWLEAYPKRGMGVYDLTTHTTQMPDIPELFAPFKLKVYGDIVVWLGEFWQGYDLERDAYFTIPVIPPGWENVPVQSVGPVTVRDGQLYWTLKSNEQTHYFTASIVPANP